jgi:rubredoxin
MKESIIKPYICSVCGYLYDIESAEKTQANIIIPFEDLPEDWVCPDCSVKQNLFTPTDSDRTPDFPESKTKEF